MKGIISNDDCRCEGTQCKKRDSCLRHTSRPDMCWVDDFSLIKSNNPCNCYIKNETKLDNRY